MKIISSARCGHGAPAATGCSWDLASKISPCVILRTPWLEWFSPGFQSDKVFAQSSAPRGAGNKMITPRVQTAKTTVARRRLIHGGFVRPARVAARLRIVQF